MMSWNESIGRGISAGRPDVGELCDEAGF